MMAAHEQTTFRCVISVETEVDATPERVWAILTDADAFASWNSTVESIGGRIAPGERLSIRVPASPGRTFRPRVDQFDPPHRMVWRDGALPLFRGTRTFLLEPTSTQRTKFTMTEELVGAMLPLILGSLPDFEPIFDRYAADLRVACEGSRGPGL